MLVFGPHENLTTLVASFSDKPIEDKTWLGVYDAEVQAEPVEISARSFKHIIKASACMSLKEIDKVFGRVFSSFP